MSRLIEEFYTKRNNLWEGSTTGQFLGKSMGYVQEFEEGTLEYRAFEDLLEAASKKRDKK